jgi:para-aminobenzoate synthetase
MNTIIIDNYDSFTYNLYQLVAEVNGTPPLVVRNDELTWQQLQEYHYDNLILSPGPGRPEQPSDFGICADALRHATTPVLGVCLGHQGLAHVWGGTVRHAPEPMHGRISTIIHRGTELFADLPQQFEVVRYHSLIVAEPLPTSLERTAWTADGLVMGLRHRERPLWGVQFHPESIKSAYGHRLLANFRDLTRQHGQRHVGRRWWQGGTAPASAPEPETAPHLTTFTRRIDHAYDAEQVFVSLFAQQPHTFWLDSSRTDAGMARFSLLGDASGPHSQVLRYNTAQRRLRIDTPNGTSERNESVFDYLERVLSERRCDTPDLPCDFNGGFVGYLGYELQAECGAEAGHPSPYPDAAGLLADRLLICDHQEACWYAVCVSECTDEADAWFAHIERRLAQMPPLPPQPAPPDAVPLTIRLARSRAGYLDDIRQAQRLIADGESYEVCLTNQIQIDARLDPLALYRILRRINPAPYAALLRLDGVSVLCSSPERFLRIDRQRWVETKPIKGTVARGDTPERDSAQLAQLQASAKDQSEHLMIVDLLRNDLGRVCEVGSVSVPGLMQIESYATVHQMVSTIRGQLRPECSVLDCVRAAFPGGSMTGAPKLRTMQIIKALETQARGVYSGTLGYLAQNGTADLNIVIRTLVMSDNRLTLGVGGALVALSDPDAEFEETLLKARALLRAVLLAAGYGQERLADVEQALRERGVWEAERHQQ